MIRFEGDRQFFHPTVTVAALLSDAAFLAGCLQNVDKVIASSADQVVCKIRTGFSFLSAALEITLTVTERSTERAGYEVHSRGVGATSRVKAALTFMATADATTVHYEAEVVERTGLLKIVSAGLIQAAARNVIEDTWKSIEAKLNESVRT